MIVGLQKLHETQGSQTKFHGIKYINLIYIYLLLLYIYMCVCVCVVHSKRFQIFCTDI